MRPRIPIITGLVLAAAALAGAQAEEASYQDGRIRFIEPGVTLQRAAEVAAEEAIANLPFLPGDRVWTDGTGRAEFQFPDGSVVRLDSGSKLDYAGHDAGREERVVLRLWSGSVIVRARTPELARIEVVTPAGIVRVTDPGLVRADVEGGETRLSVYAGQATFDDGQGEVRLGASDRVFARWGQRAAQPEPFDLHEGDAFAEWDARRDSDERTAAASPYLPPELGAYSGELERNGSWRYETSVGYVWAPYVSAGWQPYSDGYWDWTPYGWTWIPNEPWGWAPSHYGRWGYSVAFGWYWAPGRTWGPAWVSWGIGGGYVSWCPLGRYNRPVTGWSGRYERGHAVARNGNGYGRGWSVARRDALGRRDLARRRVGADAGELSALRIAESPSLRPTRDGRTLRDAGAFQGAVRRKLTPGDFVRELAVDNKTTIPAPWLHEGEERGRVGRADSRRETATGRATAGRAERAPEARSAAPRAGAAERRAPSVWSGSSAGSRERASSQQRMERRQPETPSRQRGQATPSYSGAPRSESRPRAQGSNAGSRGARPRAESGSSGAASGSQRSSSGRAQSSSRGSAGGGGKAAQRAPRPRNKK